MDCALFQVWCVYAKHCISFSLIIIGVCNRSYLVLWVSAVSAVFTQRNTSKVEVSNLTSRYMGKVKRVQCHFYLHFLLAVNPLLKCFVWECSVRVMANISHAIILKRQIDVTLYNWLTSSKIDWYLFRTIIMENIISCKTIGGTYMLI